jgi:DNA-directed RNA polymerase specialized sigma24 family protein
VIARAGLYIARLADTEISGSVAGWLLRSVERDLIDDARRARRTGDDLAVDDPPGDTAPLIRHHQAPSAEDAAFAGPLVWGALCDATRRGALSSASARVVLLHAVGHSLPDLARRAGTSRASVTASATGATPNSGTASPSPADPPSRRQACGETNPRSAALATDHPAPS